MTISNGVRSAVIAGAGPAGLTCAMYLSRAGWTVDVYSDEERSTSSLVGAPVVENYPGFPGGIPGADLLDLFVRQAENAGAALHGEGVCSIDAAGRSYTLTDGTVRSFDGSAMVLAVGLRPRGYSCRGIECAPVHTCAVCDGGLYGKSDDVVVIGGGDAAIGAARYLSGVVGSVRVLVRRDVLRVTNRRDADALRRCGNVEVVYHARLDDVRRCEDGRYRGSVYNTIDGTVMPIRFDGIFACTGYDPVDTVSIKGDDGSGVIARIGDCDPSNGRQVVLACASGAKAALDLIGSA